MIRVLFGAGTAAAANGITADVDLLLDAGAAGSAGDDFTINLTLDEGAATGEGFSAGLDESVALSITGGQVAAGVEIAGADETVTVTFSSGQAPGGGLNADVGVSLVAGEAEGNSFDADAAAYIAAVEAADAQTLELAVKTAYNDFVVGCKSDGIWNAIKASCILAGARTLAGALVPLKGAAPTNFNFVSGDYNRKTGLIGNGSTKYLNSNRAGNADPQNNRHWAVFPTAVATSGSFPRLIECGRSDTTASNTLVENLSTNSYAASNSLNTFFDFDPRVPVKLVGGSRSNSSEFVFRRSGGSAVCVTASTGVSALNWELYRSVNPSIREWSSARMSFYSIGEALDLALLDTRVSTLISAIDAAIP
jgi:hypothetical protein